MVDLTKVTALAIKAQSSAGTFASPSATTDILPVANCNWSPNAISVSNPEYRGTIHDAGPIILGATYDLTFDLMIRGPGGASPPTADAFIMGRVLRALLFTENVVSAAIPASAEALGGTGNTTTVAALGAGATGTDNLYAGLAIELASLGTLGAPASLAMIASYVGTGKLATIAQTAGSAFAGNYQIPKQLAYVKAGTGTPPLLSFSHFQGNRRFDFVDMAPSGATLTLSTSSQGSANLCKLSLKFTGNLQAYADDSTQPIATSSIPIPPFKGGKLHVDGIALGGSELTIDLSPKVGFPPNPNKAAGNDPAQLVGEAVGVTLKLNRTAVSVKDFILHAQNQDNHYIQALFGLSVGNYIGVALNKVRFDFPAPDAGGDFFMDTIKGYIDDPVNNLSISMIYY